MRITFYSASAIGDSIGENDIQNKIIALMTHNPKISASKIASTIGIASRNVETRVKKLKQAGLINRVGTPKGGHWIVIQSKNSQE
ncbi:MAG: winged helix-turn-helix domain-containing protein [Peptococcaceae bacterium]|nr:winged helix-turn-helix domain-containing protein [Peptococcaceae bacterium]